MLTSSNSEIGIWNAWVFMIVFILQMIIMSFANEQIRKRTHVPNSARKTLIEKYIGFIANFFWLVALVYSIFLPFLLGSIWFYVGLSVFIIGILILMFATVNFMTTPVEQLIQKGVYKYSRHPMYLATFLICLGAGISTASFIFILVSIIIAICFHYEAILEEKYCLSIYQDQYKEYMNSVPRWIGIHK
jgi:protein-S-isoprenylcysteine O-methyltransferase Ste14